MAINLLTHAIMDPVLLAHAYTHPLNVHAQLSGGPRGILFGPCLGLNLDFVYASNEGSDETVQLHSLV